MKTEDIFVVKCGGSTLNALPSSFYEELVQLQKSGYAPVLVHGGGPAISEKLEQMKIRPHFVDGLRVTDEDTLTVVEMVLVGQTNRYIVRRLIRAGGKAVGLSGTDGPIIHAEKWRAELGFVGLIQSVDPALLFTLIEQGYIPVVSPLGLGSDGQQYNINADTSAGAIAGALGASRMLMATDVPGVLKTEEGEKTLMERLTLSEIESLIDRNVIHGGMIPKVRAARDALLHGVREVVILQGSDGQSVTQAACGRSAGTRIVNGGENDESFVSHLS